MKRRMTAEEARAFVARWKLVNEAELAELKRTQFDSRITQLESAMAKARRLGWTQHLAEGDLEVWERWQRLRIANGD